MMKKNVIALLLAVIMASGSVGAVPALAVETAVTETTAEEAVAADEEVSDEQEEVSEIIEDSDSGLTDENVLEEESAQTEEEPVQVDEETVGEANSADEQNESDDDAETSEMTEDAEEAVTESSEGGDTSAETAEIKEQDVIEEEVIATESNEAMFGTSGKCGTNATWSISGTTLTISGSGAIEDNSFYIRKDWGMLPEYDRDLDPTIVQCIFEDYLYIDPESVKFICDNQAQIL